MNNENFKKLTDTIDRRLKRMIGKTITELSFDNDNVIIRVDKAQRLNILEIANDHDFKKYHIRSMITPLPKLVSGASELTVSGFINANHITVKDLSDYGDRGFTTENVLNHDCIIESYRIYDRPVIRESGVAPKEHTLTLSVSFVKQRSAPTGITITLILK